MASVSRLPGNPRRSPVSRQRGCNLKRLSLQALCGAEPSVRRTDATLPEQGSGQDRGTGPYRAWAFGSRSRTAACGLIQKACTSSGLFVDRFTANRLNESLSSFRALKRRRAGGLRRLIGFEEPCARSRACTACRGCSRGRNGAASRGVKTLSLFTPRCAPDPAAARSGCCHGAAEMQLFFLVRVSVASHVAADCAVHDFLRRLMAASVKR